MEDLIYLTARYTVKINVENRNWGTSKNDISLSAVAVAENEGRKLTAHSHAYGVVDKTAEVREEVVRGVLARLRAQTEALEALK